MSVLKSLWHNPRGPQQPRFPLGHPEAGTTLIEILAALFIMGLVVMMIVPFAGQIFTHWQTHLNQADVEDQLLRATIRLQSEIATALPIQRITKQGDRVIAFAGNSDHYQFVHGVTDQNGAHLETVVVSLKHSNGKISLVRRQALFDPDQASKAADPIGAGVTVISGATSMQLAYVSQDGQQMSSWTGQTDLPKCVTLSVDGKRVGGLSPLDIDLCLNAQ